MTALAIALDRIGGLFGSISQLCSDARYCKEQCLRMQRVCDLMGDALSRANKSVITTKQAQALIDLLVDIESFIGEYSNQSRSKVVRWLKSTSIKNQFIEYANDLQLQIQIFGMRVMIDISDLSTAAQQDIVSAAQEVEQGLKQEISEVANEQKNALKSLMSVNTPAMVQYDRDIEVC